KCKRFQVKCDNTLLARLHLNNVPLLSILDDWIYILVIHGYSNGQDVDVFEILPWPHLDVGYTLFVHVLDSPPYIQFSRNMYSRTTFKLNKVCHELNVILVVFSTYKYSDRGERGQT
ncbi:Uncharacterized protein APZ42_003670, partial [Daphnia magna]